MSGLNVFLRTANGTSRETVVFDVEGKTQSNTLNSVHWPLESSARLPGNLRQCHVTLVGESQAERR